MDEIPEHIYMCIDLKSFYASVECAARGLDSFTTNLVVADPTRTQKTICLAITPAMKDLGVQNRCRVFQIPEGVDYIMAPPRMRLYMEVSAEIYAIYLRYISPEDIHVYSIDEVFIDATPYLRLYDKTPQQLAQMLMDAVFDETGICATAGIGTNLFLAKVALDITAKHVESHIGYLDEEEFRRSIWDHRPITDVWNIGPGIARRLAGHHVFDLRGVCAMDQAVLYKEFGVNAEYLIDHAHGIEPCTIRQIHEYVPRDSSMTNGQVLACDYTRDQAFIVLREMVDTLVLEMVEKQVVAQQVSLMVGFARDNGEAAPYAPGGARGYRGPRAAVSRKLSVSTSSFKKLWAVFCQLWDEVVPADAAIRRLNIGVGNVLPEECASLDLFTDVQAEEREHDLATAVLAVKEKFGKNALLRGTSLQDRATGRERNNQVGGHHA